MQAQQVQLVHPVPTLARLLRQAPPNLKGGTYFIVTSWLGSNDIGQLKLTRIRFANHWRWVLMIVLLAILLPAFALTIICLKRRSKRKREAAQLAHNGGLAASGNQENRHSFLGGIFRSNSQGSNGRESGSRTNLRRSGTPATMTSVAGRTEMWGPHQGTAHTRGWGDYSSEDLQARSAERAGVGEKTAEVAIAPRAATSAGEQTTKLESRRDRGRGSRSERHSPGNGKGKERSNVDICEDDAEYAGNTDKRRKRRSRSQRQYRQKDIESDTASRFSM